ncbi:response regulator transcription factor [Paenibacillus turicensis]|nr:response regulator transcription factor [Paenibacillus turicensis]
MEPAMNYDCLIVDDEVALAETTSEYFNMFNVTTAYVTNAEDCEQFLQKHEVSLILLDINLGETSGFELCKKLRQTSQIPILFISARTSDDDVLIALNIGGDDYIHKPYTLSILLAKVKVILKRLELNTIPSSTVSLLQFHHIKVDLNLSRVYIAGKETKFTALEYKLLCYFIINKNRIITKEELFTNVWEDRFTGDGTLNVHIRHIREKIETDPNQPEYIKTIWGRGYVLEDKRK